MAKRNWCFTLNNPTSNDTPQGWGSYCIWQLEKGEDTGTPHLQGYVEFDKVVRLSALKKLSPTAHWEPRMGSQEDAIKYVTKEETKVDGPWSSGTLKHAGRRTDIHQMAEDIVKNKRKFSEISEDYPTMVIKFDRGIKSLIATIQPKYTHDDVRGEWYWGAPGTGKSTKAFKDNPGAFEKEQNKWFCGYEGEEVIILDDFDHGGKCLGHKLKRWADKFQCSGEVKGGKVQLSHKKFIITSNYTIESIFGEDPEMTKAIERRFKVTHFNQTPWHYTLNNKSNP